MSFLSSLLSVCMMHQQFDSGGQERWCSILKVGEMKKYTLKGKHLYTLILVAIVFFVAIGIVVYESYTQLIFFSLSMAFFVLIIIKIVKDMNISITQLRLSEERFRVTIEHVNNVLFDNVLEANITSDCLIGENARELTILLGIPENSSYSDTIVAISKKLVKEEFSQEYRESLSVSNILNTLKNGCHILEYECIEKSDGVNYAWIRIHYCIYHSDVADSVCIISYVKNIEEEKRAFNTLLEKVNTDSLTGLCNKVSTRESISHLLTEKSRQTHAMIMIDIDNFKQINDTYGHDYGDVVIVSIAEQMKKVFRNTDILGRIGGDEFLICMIDVSDVTKVVERFTMLRKNLSLLYSNQGKDIKISLSAGIVMIYGTQEFGDLYHFADVALYCAKENGKDQYCVYNYNLKKQKKENFVEIYGK
ncbi:MAG: diguanylate cyclase [Aminipila sp.]